MFRDKLNLTLIAGIAIALCGILVFSSASIVKAAPTYTGIEIRAQDYTTAVTSITFPQAEPGATVSNPSNSESETQTFGGAGSAKPVVTLVNTDSGNAYTIWYNITTWDPAGVVASEDYVIKDKAAACVVGDVTNAVTFGTDTISVGPTTIAASGEMDLYLKVGLSAAYGKSGTSTLTILGEL